MRKISIFVLLCVVQGIIAQPREQLIQRLQRLQEPTSLSSAPTLPKHTDWWQDAFAQDYVLTRGDFKEILTGIKSLTPAPSPVGEGNCYDLMGRPWVEGRHGLYIKNGKKYIK